MKNKISFRTTKTFDEVENLIRPLCIYAYHIRLGGLESSNGTQRKVITVSFEEKRDRDAVKNAIAA